MLEHPARVNLCESRSVLVTPGGFLHYSLVVFDKRLGEVALSLDITLRPPGCPGKYIVIVMVLGGYQLPFVFHRNKFGLPLFGKIHFYS